MLLSQFTKSFTTHMKEADTELDAIGKLLDHVEGEGDKISAAREAFVQAQLAWANLNTKLKAVNQEDLDEDEDEEEDEEEEEDA